MSTAYSLSSRINDFNQQLAERESQLNDFLSQAVRVLSEVEPAGITSQLDHHLHVIQTSNSQEEMTWHLHSLQSLLSRLADYHDILSLRNTKKLTEAFLASLDMTATQAQSSSKHHPLSTLPFKTLAQHIKTNNQFYESLKKEQMDSIAHSLEGTCHDKHWASIHKLNQTIQAHHAIQDICQQLLITEEQEKQIELKTRLKETLQVLHQLNVDKTHKHDIEKLLPIITKQATALVDTRLSYVAKTQDNKQDAIHFTWLTAGILLMGVSMFFTAPAIILGFGLATCFYSVFDFSKEALQAHTESSIQIGDPHHTGTHQQKRFSFTKRLTKKMLLVGVALACAVLGVAIPFLGLPMLLVGLALSSYATIRLALKARRNRLRKLYLQQKHIKIMSQYQAQRKEQYQSKHSDHDKEASHPIDTDIQAISSTAKCDLILSGHSEHTHLSQDELNSLRIEYDTYLKNKPSAKNLQNNDLQEASKKIKSLDGTIKETPLFKDMMDDDPDDDGGAEGGQIGGEGSKPQPTLTP